MKNQTRLAIFVDQFPVLSETFVLNQLTGLIDRGLDVDIYPLRPGGDARHHPDVARYRLLERVCPARPSVSRLLGAPGQLVRGLRKTPRIYLGSLNGFRFGSNAMSLRMIYCVAPLLERKPYDAVLCHFGPVAASALNLKELGALSGHFITVFHGSDLSRHVQLRGDRVYDRLFLKGDLFLPVSERWRQRLLELGCPPDRMRVHRMGVDPKTFVFRPRVPPADARVRLLSVGRLVEKKGFEYGIRAVADLARRNPSRKIDYTIIGGGPLQKPLTDLILQLQMSDKIKLVGAKTQQEVLAAMQAAHILLAPSVTSSEGDQEGIPVVIMEGLATGLPVVSTLHSGIPELVDDTVSGFLVPERNVTALAGALEHLIENPNRWPQLGKAGRLHVVANYNISKLLDDLVKMIESLRNITPNTRLVSI